MPGIYTEKVVVTVPLHIFAPADGPRPVITWAGGGETTFEISDVAAGTTVAHLEIRATGTAGTALEADGAVTATDLRLAATAQCAVLLASAPSQLGPGVTATTSSNGYPCVDAGFRAPDTVIGVTVNAPGTIGVNFSGPATLTDSTVNAEDALFATGGTVRRTTLNGADVGLRAFCADGDAGLRQRRDLDPGRRDRRPGVRRTRWRAGAAQRNRGGRRKQLHRARSAIRRRGRRDRSSDRRAQRDRAGHRQRRVRRAWNAVGLRRPVRARRGDARLFERQRSGWRHRHRRPSVTTRAPTRCWSTRPSARGRTSTSRAPTRRRSAQARPTRAMGRPIATACRTPTRRRSAPTSSSARPPHPSAGPGSPAVREGMPAGQQGMLAAREWGDEADDLRPLRRRTGSSRSDAPPLR